MTRRTKIVGLATAMTVAAVALGVLFRAALLETFLRAALATRGVAAVSLKVEDLGWREAAIANISLGAIGEARAERLVVAYHPYDLLAGRLQSIDIDGLNLTLDLTGAAPPLGSLQGLAGAPDDGTAREIPPAIPRVALVNAQVRALTPHGPASARLDGRLEPDPAGDLGVTLKFDALSEPGRLRGTLEATRGADGTIDARLALEDGALAFPGAELRGLGGRGSFRARGAVLEAAALDLSLGAVSLPGASFERARVVLDLAARHLDLSAELETGDGELSLRLAAALDGFPDQPEGEVRVEADIGAAGILWPLLALPAPAAGRIQASLVTQGRLPPLGDILDNDPRTLLSQAPEDVLARAALQLQGITYPGTVQELSGEARLEARPAVEGSNFLRGALDLDLNAAEARHGDFMANQIATTQSLDVEAGFENATATFRDNNKITVRDFTQAGALESMAPLAARIESGTASATFAGARGGEVSLDLTLAPEPLQFRIGGQGREAQAVTFTAEGLHARVDRDAAEGTVGRLRIAGGTIALPDLALTAEGLAATLDFDDDGGAEAVYEIGALRHGTKSPVLAPLRLSGTAKKAGDVIDFSTTAADENGHASLNLKGRHDLSKGRGGGSFGLAPLTFAPGGAQPGALFPALADLKSVTGQARARIDASWRPRSISGTADLRLEDIGFESPTARVEGLSLDLALDRLQPPGSAPGQSLRIRRIDPGVPVEDLSVRFQLLPGAAPAIAIAEGALSLAGGRFLLADVVFDPGRDQQHLPVKVEALDLSEVFALLGVEGLAGDGLLSGMIPLRLSGGALAIEQGRLAAQGPGRLQIESDYASQALAAAGESADLLLRALADFHYQELSLTINQPSEALAQIGLSMLGNNPGVLDGYPFRFNVNLETDPRKLLGALQAALRITDRAIRQMWMPDR